MKADLCYASCTPWHGRRRWRVLLLTVPGLIVSYALAVPRIRDFHAQHVRRVQIRDQIQACFQNADGFLTRRDPSGAAIELIRAEFPLRVERSLFRRSEFE